MLVRGLQQAEARFQPIFVRLRRVNVAPERLPDGGLHGDGVALPVKRVCGGAGEKLGEPVLNVHGSSEIAPIGPGADPKGPGVSPAKKGGGKGQRSPTPAAKRGRLHWRAPPTGHPQSEK